MDFLRFYFPFFCIHWLMGDYLLPTDPFGNADYFWSNSVGILHITKVGEFVG